MVDIVLTEQDVLGEIKWSFRTSVRSVEYRIEAFTLQRLRCHQSVAISQRLVECCVLDIERCVPDTERCVPDIECCLPDIECCLPDIERCVPDIERCVPDIEHCVPDIERCVPDRSIVALLYPLSVIEIATLRQQSGILKLGFRATKT